MTIDQKELEQVSARVFRKWAEEDKKRRKEGLANLFVAILVIVGLFTVAIIIGVLVPSPWDIFCIFGLAVIWLYCFEN